MRGARRLVGGVAVVAVCVMLAQLSGRGAWADDPKGRRDPFVPLVTQEGVMRPARMATRQPPRPSADGELVLGGIVYDPAGGSLAVINGNLVRVGDVVGDAEVTGIEPSRVVVLRGGAPQELRLPEHTTSDEERS